MTTRGSQILRLMTGVGLLAFGLTFVALSIGYGLGSLRNFGPGFFPFMFGIFLVATVAADLIHTLRDTDAPGVDRVSPRRVLFICLSLIAFGLLLKPTGFVPAVFVATALAMRADSEVSWLLVIGYALVLSAIGYLLFLRLLGIPLTAFG